MACHTGDWNYPSFEQGLFTTYVHRHGLPYRWLKPPNDLRVPLIVSLYTAMACHTGDWNALAPKVSLNTSKYTAMACHTGDWNLVSVTSSSVTVVHRHGLPYRWLKLIALKSVKSASSVHRHGLPYRWLKLYKLLIHPAAKTCTPPWLAIQVIETGRI